MDLGHPISRVTFRVTPLDLSEIPLLRSFLPPPYHRHGFPSVPPVDPSVRLSLRTPVKQWRPPEHDVREQSQVESLSKPDNPLR